jgi:glutamate decarboxylase
VSAYTFPANRTDLAACRVVVRIGSKDAADLFVDDLRRAVASLDRVGGGMCEHRSGFHH